MANQYDKPFKTFEEMALYLETAHGLSIPNGDEERAYISNLLHVIPYYDLVNGYKDYFMKDDRFISGTRIRDLELLYSVDRGFQNVLFPFSIAVEDYFKNILAYILAKDFGVHQNDYLAPRNYITNRKNLSYRTVRDKICSIYSDNKKDKRNKKEHKHIDEPTYHYVSHHNHIPPWILLKNVTFSISIDLFTLLKSYQKREIANMMIPVDIPVDQKIQLLLYALTVIRRCRNQMAHNLKFISFSAYKYGSNINRSALTKWIPRELSSAKELKKGHWIYDIYSYILFSMALLPDQFHKLLLLTRLSDYIIFISKDSEVLEEYYQQYLTITHLPKNLPIRLKHYKEVVADNC